ncbi:HIT family protein [Deinococcus aestuarii]|uniref:HIT family protein n=1 Tax=Deinococcus aestuarii TaxID=2774531 RepID=UPI001C0AB125|nr:HIT family protein [Deinococcus aestuarii]
MFGQEQGCVFCRIVRGEAEASLVHEDDLVTAFLDINPGTPGHVLVVPRRHVAGLGELEDAEAARLMLVGRSVLGALRGGAVRCEGVNLFLADGEAAGQEVGHAHLHVFPRFAGDGFALHGDWTRFPPRAELDALAARLRAALG